MYALVVVIEFRRLVSVLMCVARLKPWIDQGKRLAVVVALIASKVEN